MILEISCFMTGLLFLYYNKIVILKHSINLVYFLIIKLIDFYSYLSMKIMRFLPSFIYIQTFTYRPTKLDFDITEYKCNFNQRFYMIRFINLDDKKRRMHNFTINVKRRIEQRNLIFNSSIQKNGEFIRDVTEELRSYFHYVSLDDNTSSREFIYKLRYSDIWEYIKVNIGLDDQYQLLVSLNDFNLTDILIE